MYSSPTRVLINGLVLVHAVVLEAAAAVNI